LLWIIGRWWHSYIKMGTEQRAPCP
jgi:hypothetical protein